ncbi:hypothetical protein LEP1GSC172_2822 [Leptospira noguchii]|uniref:Uncharacterized protein n=2 Tax=Leptospira noguchii TaxID=28182 RepID=T0GW84_9LEPT|nr:hypothetical protein LEP1GSC172_2822 [Leptospira noguchii]EQA73162.1 hypothetical protein LEP1GSC059_0131 [Leptospira noguchii serovar Panama str. CZ214]
MQNVLSRTFQGPAFLFAKNGSKWISYFSSNKNPRYSKIVELTISNLRTSQDLQNEDSRISLIVARFYILCKMNGRFYKDAEILKNYI